MSEHIIGVSGGRDRDTVLRYTKAILDAWLSSEEKPEEGYGAVAVPAGTAPEAVLDAAALTDAEEGPKCMDLFDHCKVAVIDRRIDHFQDIIEAADKSSETEVIMLYAVMGETPLNMGSKPLMTPVEYMVGFEVEPGEAGTRFAVSCAAFEGRFFLPAPGSVENALAAVSLCQAVGVPPKFMQEVLGEIHE